MASKVTVDWNGKEVLLQASQQLRTNAEGVGMFLEGKVVRSLSKGQPAVRVGKRLVGKSPSKPGQPPRLLHGNLRNSIYHRVLIGRRTVAIMIGANTPYARALEFGYPKGNLEERPYLRPAIRKNREKAIQRLVRGLFK